MDRETLGTVVSVAKQWWLKVNTKPIRIGALSAFANNHPSGNDKIFGGIFLKNCG